MAKSKKTRLITFVVGTDKFVRINNPKYDGDCINKLLNAVRERGNLGAYIVYSRRLDQSKNDFDK